MKNGMQKLGLTRSLSVAWRRQPYAVFVNDKPLQAPAFSLREKRSGSSGRGAKA